MASVTEPLLASFDNGRVYATLRYDDATLLCDRLIVVVSSGTLTGAVADKSTGQVFGPFSFTQNTTRNIPAGQGIRRDNLGRSPTATLTVRLSWAP